MGVVGVDDFRWFTYKSKFFKMTASRHSGFEYLAENTTILARDMEEKSFSKDPWKN